MAALGPNGEKLTKKRITELVRASLKHGHYINGPSIKAKCATCGQMVECQDIVYDFAPGHVQRKLTAGMIDHITEHCGECATCGVLYGQHEAEMWDGKPCRETPAGTILEGNHA